PAFPYDFAPITVEGAAFQAEGCLRVPRAVLQALPLAPAARGAWVGWESERRDTSDVMEIVIGAPENGSFPEHVLVAQVVFDLAQPPVDAFAAAATRVLEPLIGELRHGLASLVSDLPARVELAAEVDRLQAALRSSASEPSRLRRLVRGSLAAIGTIVLGILAARVDDAIPWDLLWHGVQEAGHRLGL
ncbi:MAG TPA: hypothetical protein VHE83_04830, partial [Mycobacteriales bacterium]|nr:hypothetical protein [Mycobacteriales bacterium]